MIPNIKRALRIASDSSVDVAIAITSLVDEIASINARLDQVEDANEEYRARLGLLTGEERTARYARARLARTTDAFPGDE